MGRWIWSVALLSSFALCWACGGDDDDANAGNAALCEQGCTATVAAGCDNGPASQSECVDDCRAFSGGGCRGAYEALQACAQGEAVTCDAQGLPVVEACSAEQDALVQCLIGGS